MNRGSRYRWRTVKRPNPPNYYLDVGDSSVDKYSRHHGVIVRPGYQTPPTSVQSDVLTRPRHVPRPNRAGRGADAVTTSDRQCRPVEVASNSRALHHKVTSAKVSESLVKRGGQA